MPTAAPAAHRRSRRQAQPSGPGGVGRKIDALRDELAGPGAPPLERILAERVALCWLDAHEADRRSHETAAVPRSTSEFRESRSDRAQKRFLAACKARGEACASSAPRPSRSTSPASR